MYYTSKRSSMQTIRLNTIAGLSLLFGINILTLYILLCLCVHKTLIKNPIFGLLLAIVILTINTVKFKKDYVTNILDSWQNLSTIKRKNINRILFVYIAVSCISFLSSISFIAYIKTKYGNFKMSLISQNVEIPHFKIP